MGRLDMPADRWLSQMKKRWAKRLSGKRREQSLGPEDELGLTKTQRRVLTVALLSGYFEFHTRTNLTQLAQELGVAPSSLSEMLRRAERKAVRDTVLMPFAERVE